MEELIEKAKNGDIGAYTEVFMKFRNDLRRVAASKLNDKSYADDIVQTVYYKAYKNLGRLDDNKNFKSWIFTILRNECINANIYSRTHLESDVDEYEESIEDSSIPSLDSRISFEDMIKDLTPSEREILRLKFEEVYTTKEISEKLGIPYNTAKSKILRAIKKIILVLLVAIMVSGFTVLANFVIKQIKAHFTTSLNAINTAVENNYVQEIDSDFVYDNGIGIKVDAIVLDDKNLDISFVYDIQDKEKYGEITGIRLEDYVVKADDEVLFDSVRDNREITNKVMQYPENYIESDAYYKNSILFSSKNNFTKVRNIQVVIKSLYMDCTKEYFLIRGNWELEYQVIDILNKRDIETYLLEENEYVKDYEVKLIDTAIQFILIFGFENEIDEYMENVELHNMESLYYTNLEGKFFEEENKLRMTFDMSKNMDNINELILEIPINEKENIILKFRRSQ